jgi:hypothetical protein
MCRSDSRFAGDAKQSLAKSRTRHQRRGSTTPFSKALARAYRWKKQLEDGTYATVNELAKAERINESYVTRILRLNLLAPDLVEAALDGNTTLTVQRISERASPIWREQRDFFDTK